MICPHCKQPIDLDELCAVCRNELPETGYKLRRVPGVGRVGKKGARKRKVCDACAARLDLQKQGELFVIDHRGQQVADPRKRGRAA